MNAVSAATSHSTPRRARPADLEALSAFEELVFATEPHRISRRQWRALLERAGGGIFVCEDQLGLTGVLVLGRRAGGRTVRILSLGVHPRARRRGMGRALLLFTAREAERAGAERIRLEVRADNRAAIALYEAEGYRVLGRLPSYYGLGEDGVRMERTVP